MQRRRQVDSHPPATTPDDAKRSRTSTTKRTSSRYLKYILVLIVVALLYLSTNHLFVPLFFAERTNEPLNLPKLVEPDRSAPERFWGTYRSNLYFGLKHRSPQSLSAGLMWFDYRTLQKSPDRFLRHWCDQNDRLKYGWTYHDGERFGIEEIEDEFINLRIEWLKQVTGQHGGDWTARIHLQPRAFGSSPPPPSAPVSLFFYFHYDHPWIKQMKTSTKQGTDRVFIRGQTNELDGFTVKVKMNHPSSNQAVIRTMTDSFNLDTIHQKILEKLTTNPPRQPLIFLLDQPFENTLHNTIFVQLTLKTLPSANEPFSFDILFQSDSSDSERTDDLSGFYFNDELIRLQKQFDQRFEEIFRLKSKQNLDEKRIQFARSTLSHLIGGIAYFTGQSLVSKPQQQIPDLYWKTNLYTAVPSRSFFPRGFLWDEGFHNLLIARWNGNLTREILSHWLDMLNSNGWIPREIILGDEARARVPPEFIVQYTSNANPPTFFLTIDYLLKIDSSDPLFTLPFIQRLEKWYQWYNRTQTGPVPFSFRWRGRNASSIYELNPKTLTSGLDDYPRASHPTDSERHLDLRCWMTLASNVLGKLYAKMNGESTNAYLQYAQLLSENDRLDQLHWSEKDEIYADYGLHTDDVQLQRVFRTKPMQGAPPPPTHMIRQTKDDAQLAMKYVKHFGYVSLFPLMTRLLNPQSEKLGKILNDLKKPNLLWTSFGLRSLAQSSPLYAARNTEHDPPYWRGAIWINMNYMVLSALQHYAKVSGPHADQARQIYRELRENLLKNMFRVYQKTGHVWEQYDDKTGEGKGCHPFNGWSSLIVLIMAELYDE